MSENYQIILNMAVDDFYLHGNKSIALFGAKLKFEDIGVRLDFEKFKIDFNHRIICEFKRDLNIPDIVSCIKDHL